MGVKDFITGAKQRLFGNTPDQQDNPMFDNQLADFVEKEYERRRRERQPFELQWRMNMEFLAGNQYLDINTTTMSIEEIPKLMWYQEREVFNQLAPIYETRTSRLTQAEPIMKVRPASNDDGDISSAKVSSMLFQSTWAGQSMDKQYAEFVSLLEVHGTCIIKTAWNPNKGRVIFDPSMMGMDTSQGDPQEAPNPDIQGSTSSDPDGDGDTASNDPDSDETNATGMEGFDKIIYEGDIDTTIVPSHEFFPDSSYRSDVKDCRSVIHAKAYHVDEIEEMYGIRVSSEDVDVMNLQKASNGMSGLGYNPGGFRTATTKIKDYAVVKEYYERSSKKYPNGRFIVAANGKTLYSGDLPYEIGENNERDLPFIRVVSVHQAGVFWGKSVIERLIPIQRRYNAFRNRKQEYLNLVTIGQWYKPQGSITEDSELNNAPANIIEYRPGVGKPEPVVYPSLPASFEHEGQELLNEFTQISGVSELSRYSNAPAGVKSGVALSIASQQDDTRITSTSNRIANSIVELGKYWLRLYRQFAQEPRILRSVGENYDVEVRDWTISDLRSDDVIIENASAMSETPTSRRAMVMNLLAAGLFNNPQTGSLDAEARQKVFQLLDFGNWEMGSDDDTKLQRSRARRENRMMMQGEAMAQVMDFDDHAMHIQQHNHMRMQAEYDEMLKNPAGQQIDAMFRAHIMSHYQAMFQAQAMGGITAPNEPQQPQTKVLPEQAYQEANQNQQKDTAYGSQQVQNAPGNSEQYLMLMQQMMANQAQQGGMGGAGAAGGDQGEQSMQAQYAHRYTQPMMFGQKRPAAYGDLQIRL